MATKPAFEEYLEDAAMHLALPPEKDFDLIATQLRNQAELHDFLIKLPSELAESAEAYNENSELLFAYRPDKLNILLKTYSSVKEKIYRVNCLTNRGFPDRPPDDGELTGQNIFEKIEDILRARIVVRYMDGPRYLCERLDELAQNLGLRSFFGPRANDRGYYAWHFYVVLPIDVMLPGGAQNINVTLEIQITTQLAEVLDKLSHKLYETERVAVQSEVDRHAWKWDPTNEKFQPAYMGHALHMLEGVLLTMKNETLGHLPGTGEAS